MGQFWLILVKIKNGFGENSPKIQPKTENYTVKYTGTAGKFSVLRGVQCTVYSTGNLSIDIFRAINLLVHLHERHLITFISCESSLTFASLSLSLSRYLLTSDLDLPPATCHLPWTSA